MNKLAAGILMGCLCMSAFGVGEAASRPVNPEKLITTLHTNFNYDKVVLARYLDKGISPNDLRTICKYAYYAQVPLEEVANLREKYVWTRVRFLLGLTPEILYERELEYKAERLEKIIGLDKNVAMAYMRMGFASHQVKRASYIASHCDIPLLDILNMKTRQLKWPDVAEKLGLPRDACMK